MRGIAVRLRGWGMGVSPMPACQPTDGDAQPDDQPTEALERGAMTR